MTSSPQPTPTPPRPTKRVMVRFVAAFAGCLLAYYLLSGTPLFKEHLLPAYLRANAEATAGILRVFGQGTRCDVNSVFSSRFSMQVERGCDAVEPTVLFLAAVIASPVAWRRKGPGLVMGIAVLAVINLLRLVTLFLTGIYWPAAFDVMHVDVWQAIFVFLALLLWVLWAMWALRPKPTAVHGQS